ncbi:aspartate kinase [uncultured Psychroserpens sp.]|uniref:aspartate kinase n=1 Tax=uncultured Psychroserpens sp. TaxID=255436 RepID=UPI002620E105|nr:aspartate kinase [uncultured Psychroserpens sp.]
MKTIHIIIFGIGKVGSTLINQINQSRNRLKQHQGISLKIPVIANSRLVFFRDETVSNSWETDFEAFSVPYKIEDVINYVKTKNYENLVVVDTTASQDFVKNYLPLIQSGFHLVSANKIANTLHFDFYKNLRQNLTKYNKHFHYETNVGAGLPVIEIVNNLLNSGDKIYKIRGVFSGSMSYIFNTFSNTDELFSKVLSKASSLGFTEPDAREDLSGADVARKLLILGRELGLTSELDQVKIESLLPKQLNGKTTLHQFNSRVKELDQPFLKLKSSLPDNKVLRYVGELDVLTEVLEVKLISEERQSVLGQLKGSDSVFEIYTEAYAESPLVIQGAGAGLVVTARGLLSDIIKLSNKLC